MEIAKELAGFTPAEADDLRKAICKKIHSLMASLKEKFLEGCAQQRPRAQGRQAALGRHGEGAGLLVQQVPRRLLRADRLPHRLPAREPPARVHGRADLVRDEHEGQACRSTSTPATRWASRSSRPTSTARRTDFAVVEGKIRFGLNAVKNVGEGAARAIIAAREEGGEFASIWDFTERVDPAVANKRALESLVKCGALDSTGASRTAMLDRARRRPRLGPAPPRRPHLGTGLDLRGARAVDADEPATTPPPDAADVADDKAERLRWEKETLGLYVSEHPLEGIRDQLRRKTDCGLAEVERRRDGEVVTVGGIVGAIKQLTTKKGDPMVFMRLDDVTGGAEVGGLQLRLRRRARADRGRPRARRQGPRRPQAGGRDEAARDRGVPVRGDPRAARGAPAGRRAAARRRA